MKAIRVAKRAKTGGYTYHLLLDEGRTFCGRKPAELDVVEELELESPPAAAACLGCLRVRDGLPRQQRDPLEHHATAEPAPGRLRTSGPLSHGFRARSGRRIA